MLKLDLHFVVCYRQVLACLFLLGILLDSSGCLAQTKSTIDPTNTIEFFQFCHDSLAVELRGEFETLEEFQKRVSIPDTTSIHYFELSPINHCLVRSYAYDIDAGQMCFQGGFLEIAPRAREEPLKRIALVIWTDTTKATQYAAQNAMGAVFSVYKWEISYSALCITNWRSLPDNAFNFGTGTSKEIGAFRHCVSMEPQVAKAASESTAFVIGVRLQPDSRYRISQSRLELPTFSNPYETDCKMQWVDVEFVELLLFNRETGEVTPIY